MKIIPPKYTLGESKTEIFDSNGELICIANDAINAKLIQRALNNADLVYDNRVFLKKSERLIKERDETIAALKSHMLKLNAAVAETESIERILSLPMTMVVREEYIQKFMRIKLSAMQEFCREK